MTQYTCIYQKCLDHLLAYDIDILIHIVHKTKGEDQLTLVTRVGVSELRWFEAGLCGDRLFGAGTETSQLRGGERFC